MDQIPNVVACDVGNARIKLGRVHGEDVQDVAQLQVGRLGELGEALRSAWEAAPQPRKLVAASVNPAALKALEAAADAALRTHVLVVGRDLPRPIDTDLPHPEQIGTDRLCCASAAFDRLGTACVVVDCGSAVTVDCVSGEGVFLGGAILPGTALQAESLAAGTAQLPNVTPAEPAGPFGKDTAEAIGAGVVRGLRAAVHGLVESYATELGAWPVVIATGGDARLLLAGAVAEGRVQAIVPDLALRGAAMAYYRSLLKE